MNLDTGRLYAYPPQEIVDTTDDDAGEESKEESEKDDDPEVEEDAWTVHPWSSVAFKIARSTGGMATQQCLSLLVHCCKDFDFHRSVFNSAEVVELRKAMKGFCAKIVCSFGRSVLVCGGSAMAKKMCWE